MIAPLLLAAALAAAPSDRLAQCLAMIPQDAEAAYEEARAWVAEQGGPEAFECAAEAEIGRGRPARGAAQFEQLAREAILPEDAAKAWSRAGNAWLLAPNPARARAAFDQALMRAKGDPDILIDRARAYALIADWRKAEEDLSKAIDARPEDPLALALRAETRLQQGAFDLALRDAERAHTLAPTSVDAALSLGRAREAKRLGRAPD